MDAIYRFATLADLTWLVVSLNPTKLHVLMKKVKKEGDEIEPEEQWYLKGSRKYKEPSPKAAPFWSAMHHTLFLHYAALSFFSGWRWT